MQSDPTTGLQWTERAASSNRGCDAMCGRTPIRHRSPWAVRRGIHQESQLRDPSESSSHPRLQPRGVPPTRQADRYEPILALQARRRVCAGADQLQVHSQRSCQYRRGSISVPDCQSRIRSGLRPASPRLVINSTAVPWTVMPPCLGMVTRRPDEGRGDRSARFGRLSGPNPRSGLGRLEDAPDRVVQ